jgi:hypothetical protein
MLYNRKYLDWWWTWYNDWIIDIIFTKKTTTIIQKEKPIVYSSWLWNKDKIRLKWIPKIEEDWSFVIYHNSQWTPFLYEKYPPR